MQIEIYDIETIKNCFTVTFYNPTTKKVSQFAIHKDRDDRKLLYDFISKDISLVGFNCIDFDTPILQFFYDNWDVDKIENKIYKVAQKRITAERNEYVEVRWKQRDLMKIHHFDNLSKFCSLKWLQINMGFENVMDMPIHHSDKITKDQIDEVLKYNLNDVMATYKLYELTFPKIKMRKQLGEKYGTDMGNFNDPKIGEYIILKMLSDKIGISIDSLKKCRTPRREVKIADCILPEVSFSSPEFKEIYDKFKATVVTSNDQEVDYSCNFNGVEYFFGLGGIHACRGTAVYSDVDSCDVTGFYPSLAVSRKFAPAHFGEAFTEVYKQIAIERKTYKKGTPENEALKLAQNGTFGKSNSEYSPFYDPMMFYKITINGQLLLAMLCERLTLEGACKIILANTDGIEVEMIDRVKYHQICSWWEDLFNLKLEHSTYSKLIVRDINNYLAVKTDGGIKEKGVFICKPELGKDNSQLIVPMALKEFFLKGTPVEVTICDTKDISPFLIGQRAKKGKFYLRKVENGMVIEQPLQKHLRYYISRSGDVLRKKTDKTDGNVHVKRKVTMFNEWKEGPYDIDTRYYISECNKIIKMFNKKTDLYGDI